MARREPSVTGGGDFAGNGYRNNPRLSDSNGQTIPYHDNSIARAMAHRLPAPSTPVVPIHPSALDLIGKGDRELAEAKKQMLDPLGMSPDAVRAKAAATAAAPTGSSTVQAAWASMQAGQRAAAAAAAPVAPVKRAPAGYIVPTVSAEARAAYAKQQLANEQGED